jgi:hypothetical protein
MISSLRREYVRLAISLFVLSAAFVSEGKLAESIERSETSSKVSVRAEPGRTTAVVASNGEAFLIEEDLASVRLVPLKTSMRVFKAFDLSSDRRFLLYSPLRNKAPSGELVVEDLSTGARVRVTSRLVLTASVSPADDQLVAYTFATGGGFGLALLKLDTGEDRVLAKTSVFAEFVQWNNSGTGIHYFEAGVKEKEGITGEREQHSLFEDYVFWNTTRRRAKKDTPDLELTERFHAVQQTDSSKSEHDITSGFPVLESGSNAGPDILGGSNRRFAENSFPFRTLAPDGRHEVAGENLLGAGRLLVRDV